MQFQANPKDDSITTHTTYDFVRWDDVVRADAARRPWRKIIDAWLLLACYLASGMLWRMARAHWRFALFFLYPYIALIAMTLAASALGATLARLTAFALRPALADAAMIGAAIGTVAAIAALVAALRLTERHTYLLYLFDDGVSTDEYVRRRRPDWDARLALFADRLIAVAQAAEADEIVVVGHSSGSFMAVDVIAQALARDPALGRHGPAIRLVTLGANLPLVGFHPAGGWFVERLQRVLAAADVVWLDVQSRKDVMSFYPFDQAVGHGLSGPLLTTVGVRFRDVLLPQNYAAFRWQFFRVHFQYLMANERPAAWDYFMLICGPRSISDAIARFRS